MLRGPLKSELRRAIPRIQRSPITYAAASAGLQRPAQPAPRPAAKPRKYEEGKARSTLRSPLRTELAQRRSFGRLAEGVAAEVRYTGRGVGSLFCRYPDATFAHTALISTSRETSQKPGVLFLTINGFLPRIATSNIFETSNKQTCKNYSVESWKQRHHIIPLKNAERCRLYFCARVSSR